MKQSSDGGQRLGGRFSPRFDVAAEMLEIVPGAHLEPGLNDDIGGGGFLGDEPELSRHEGAAKRVHDVAVGEEIDGAEHAAEAAKDEVCRGVGFFRESEVVAFFETAGIGHDVDGDDVVERKMILEHRDRQRLGSSAVRVLATVHFDRNANGRNRGTGVNSLRDAALVKDVGIQSLQVGGNHKQGDVQLGEGSSAEIPLEVGPDLVALDQAP